MGTFIFRWEAKGIPRTDLGKDMIKEALGESGANAEIIFLDMYAPTDVTIVVWVTKERTPIEIEYDMRRMVRDTFTQRYELFDIIDIDHGGSVMNIFTRANGLQASKIYQCASVIEHDYMDQFADYLDAFTQEATDTTILNKINIKVKEGIDTGLDGLALLSYVERVYGTGNRTLIINSITAQTSYRPQIKIVKPVLSERIINPTDDELLKYTDNQVRILNFVRKLMNPRGTDMGADHRNLLICGPPRTFKTSFAYFLNKYFHIYWKGVGVKGTHEFWRGIPKETSIIVVDEWIPQESDWMWMNKVGEGSEHAVDQKYKEDNIIPAGTRILLLTNRHPSEIRNACSSTSKGKDNSGDELWAAFTRRFAIANLTADVIPLPNGRVRKDVVQSCMSSDHFEHPIGDIRQADNPNKSGRLSAIAQMPVAEKIPNLVEFVRQLITENIGLGVVIKHRTMLALLANEPTEETALSVIAELSDLINLGLS
jgi:hypothetical protein